MNKRHAVIKDNRVINVIVWDGESQWSPPQECTVVQHDNCDIGDKWCPEKKALIKPCRVNRCDLKEHVNGEPCVDRRS